MANARSAMILSHANRLSVLLGPDSSNRVNEVTAATAMQRFVGQKRREREHAEQPSSKRACREQEDFVNHEEDTDLDSDSEFEPALPAADGALQVRHARTKVAASRPRAAAPFRRSRIYSEKGYLYREIKAAASGGDLRAPLPRRKAAINAARVTREFIAMDVPRTKTVRRAEQEREPRTPPAAAVLPSVTPPTPEVQSVEFPAAEPSSTSQSDADPPTRPRSTLVRCNAAEDLEEQVHADAVKRACERSKTSSVMGIFALLSKHNLRERLLELSSVGVSGSVPAPPGLSAGVLSCVLFGLSTKALEVLDSDMAQHWYISAVYLCRCPSGHAVPFAQMCDKHRSIIFALTYADKDSILFYADGDTVVKRCAAEGTHSVDHTAALVRIAASESLPAVDVPFKSVNAIALRKE